MQTADNRCISLLGETLEDKYWKIGTIFYRHCKQTNAMWMKPTVDSNWELIDKDDFVDIIVHELGL